MNHYGMMNEYEMSKDYEELVMEILQKASKTPEDAEERGWNVFFKRKRIGRVMFTLIHTECSEGQFEQINQFSSEACARGIYCRCLWDDGKARIRIVEECA